MQIYTYIFIIFLGSHSVRFAPRKVSTYYKTF